MSSGRPVETGKEINLDQIKKRTVAARELVKKNPKLHNTSVDHLVNEGVVQLIAEVLKLRILLDIKKKGS